MYYLCNENKGADQLRGYLGLQKSQFFDDAAQIMMKFITIIKLTSMKIAHSNINGIRNKKDDINVNLSDYDIICVSETKPNEHIQTDSYQNPTSRKHGRVMNTPLHPTFI